MRTQLFDGVWRLVRASEPVEVSEQVAVVVSEQRVVYVVVRSSGHTNGSKSSIPRVHGFAVNQAEPVGIQSAKSHVGPDVYLKVIERHASQKQHASTAWGETGQSSSLEPLRFKKTIEVSWCVAKLRAEVIIYQKA